MDHSKLVVAQAFGSQGEADLAMSMLQSAGINATVQADAAGGMEPPLGWCGLGFRVLVREEDASAARDVLQSPPASDLVFVQGFATQDEADAAQGALLSAGIAARIQDDSPTGWRSDVPWSGSGFQMLVPKEDAEKARKILTSPTDAKA